MKLTFVSTLFLAIALCMQVVPTSMGEQVLCESCGLYSHFVKCRLISKREQLWRCSSCGVKHTQLRRLLGGWPNESFSLLPKEPTLAIALALEMALPLRIAWRRHCRFNLVARR